MPPLGARTTGFAAARDVRHGADVLRLPTLPTDAVSVWSKDRDGPEGIASTERVRTRDCDGVAAAGRGSTERFRADSCTTHKD